MVCLGLEPMAAGWKLQTNPLSYGGTPIICNHRFILCLISSQELKLLAFLAYHKCSLHNWKLIY